MLCNIEQEKKEKKTKDKKKEKKDKKKVCIMFEVCAFPSLVHTHLMLKT